MGIEPGDTLFVETKTDQGQTVLRYAKAENPFDLLAAHALKERQAGRTGPLRAIATDNASTGDGS